MSNYKKAKLIKAAWETSGYSFTEFARLTKMSRGKLKRYINNGLKKKEIPDSAVDISRIVSYGGRHSERATKNYAERIHDKRNGRYVRVGHRNVYGDKAEYIKNMYDKANKARERAGMDKIYPKNFKGTIENLIKSLKTQQDGEKLRVMQLRGIENFKRNYLSFLLESNGGWDTRYYQQAKTLLNSLTPDEVNQLWRDNEDYFTQLLRDSKEKQAHVSTRIQELKNLVGRVVGVGKVQEVLNDMQSKEEEL